MITEEIRSFVEKRVQKLLSIGGYKPYRIVWSKDWGGIWLPGYKGHYSVFHGIWRDVERAVRKKYRKKISLYLKRTPRESLPEFTKRRRSNSAYNNRAWGAI